MSRMCGFCGARPAVAIDEEDRVPICAGCRDDEVPQPKPVRITDRVVAALRRLPGLTMGELAELLGMEEENERASLTQVLCRGRQRGDLIAFGGKMERRYHLTSCTQTSSGIVDCQPADEHAQASA